MTWERTSVPSWRPDKANAGALPPVGRLVALAHGVHRVAAVEYPDLNEDQAARWVAANCPDIEKWAHRPVRVHLVHVGGQRPRGRLFGPAGEWRLDTEIVMAWYTYPPSGRWPMCSCCGEPMPCTAELEDRAAHAAARRLEDLMSRMPGCCWYCAEPITSRQQAVAYPGQNLDLPIGPEVRFHLRVKCWHAAATYERRWIAVDPRRERIITYPSCGGWLVVHDDGSSECLSPDALTSPVNLGTRVTAPGCEGHLTHDHNTMAACYALSRDWQCPRGCSTDPRRHPGTRTTPRPLRRDQTQLAP